jgi:hypothetical protein
MPDGSFNLTTTNLDVLIAHLEAVPNVGETGWVDPVTGNRAWFYMGAWCGANGECGTAACLAGHAALLADPVRFWAGSPLFEGERAWPFESMIPLIAAKWLGLEKNIADQLFHAFDDNGSVAYMERITAAEAIETLHRLRNTGRVDWSHAVRYQKRLPLAPVAGLSGTTPSMLIVDGLDVPSLVPWPEY